MKHLRKHLRGIFLLCLLALLGLQVFFALRILCMRWINPESTAFERTALVHWVLDAQRGAWQQQWQPSANISTQLKRAVIASEDSGFAEHFGVEWDAIVSAWERNQKAKTKASTTAQGKPSKSAQKPVKIVGGSTITQQLAKNLFLSGERNFLRKGQELVIAWMLEAMLDKQRVLEIYLNHVEWGQSIFGAQAAAKHYFNQSAKTLNAFESARLAVMLPRPRYFEKHWQSAYLYRRAARIKARMPGVVLP